MRQSVSGRDIKWLMRGMQKLSTLIIIPGGSSFQKFRYCGVSEGASGSICGNQIRTRGDQNGKERDSFSDQKPYPVDDGAVCSGFGSKISRISVGKKL